MWSREPEPDLHTGSGYRLKNTGSATLDPNSKKLLEQLKKRSQKSPETLKVEKYEKILNNYDEMENQIKLLKSFENYIISRDNHDNHENLRISIGNHENHENLRIICENYENHENHRIS